MICIASRHRPVSKNKNENPCHLPLPPLFITHSLNPDLLSSTPRHPPKIRAPRPPSKNSGRCMFGFPLKLFLAPFQVHVPKTIKWPSLLSQFSGATIRLPAPGAAIKLPVRPPCDRSHFGLVFNFILFSMELVI